MIAFLRRGLFGWLAPGVLVAAAIPETTLVMLTGDVAGIRLQWAVQSMVPSPGTPLFAHYQVEQSGDLVSWTPVGPRLKGEGRTVLEVVQGIPPASQAGVFYRLQWNVEQARSDLHGVRLDDANLRGADLSDGDMIHASLRNADLRGARLDGIRALGADFSGADLRGGRLPGADLRDARFNDARLDGADLFAARLEHADLTGADLNGADLRFANLAAATLIFTDLTDADLRGSSLVGADIRLVPLHRTRLDAFTQLPPKDQRIWSIVNEGHPGAVLTNLDLSLAVLSDLDLSGTDFSGCDLTATSFERSDLRGAVLTGANLRFTFWANSIIDDRTVLTSKARLNWRLVNEGGAGASLRGADLSAMVLFEVNLEQAILVNASFRQSSLIGANFRGANLTGANLGQTDLEDADFTGANLTRVNFSGALFKRTVMPDGSIRSP